MKTNQRIVPFNDLRPKGLMLARFMLDTWKVMRSGKFILDKQVKEFEYDFAQFTNTDDCVALGNGHDAIKFALMALDSKVVVTPTNVPLAVWSAVRTSGARIVPVDTEQYYNDVINYKTIDWSDVDTVLVVHMFGKYNTIDRTMFPKEVRIVEDFSQAHMAPRLDKTAGAYSDLCVWSFYPTKNLGAFGDAGAVTCYNTLEQDRHNTMLKIADMREYGKGNLIGGNSRMDELQAAYLRTRLKFVEKEWAKRLLIGRNYQIKLKPNIIRLSNMMDNHSFHQFVIVSQYRDVLKAHLQKNGIGTAIHYPKYPIHMPQFQDVNTSWSNTCMMEDRFLSLPIHGGMSEKDVDYVIRKVNEF